MTIKKILATKELTLNMGGVVYDVLLIPRERVVEMDYSQCPEDAPKLKKKKKKDKGKDL